MREDKSLNCGVKNGRTNANSQQQSLAKPQSLVM